ncbi:hypothetical protein [Spirochaeta lutea]|uniref:Uncharacterized protein n=1 Tax=Spirochaeta lutea TaxID=1480694 RepID=A0A098QXZ7_9SPIO|nr:hypothetical protein [Spirochaeta lutea]KGE72416.1 hypothetical protein DC28_07065 [Spirochaeta lutea]
MFSLRQYITSPGYTGIRTIRWGVGLLVAVWLLHPQILSGQAVQPELWIPREILASEGPVRSGQSSLAMLRQKHSQDLLVFWAMEPKEFFTKKAAFMASLQDYQHAVDGILKSLVSIQPGTAPGGGDGQETRIGFWQWLYGRDVLPDWVASAVDAQLPLKSPTEPTSRSDTAGAGEGESGGIPGTLKGFPPRIEGAFPSGGDEDAQNLFRAAATWVNHLGESGDVLLQAGFAIAEGFALSAGSSRGSGREGAEGDGVSQESVPALSSRDFQNIMVQAGQVITRWGYPRGGILQWYYALPLIKALESPYTKILRWHPSWKAVRLYHWMLKTVDLLSQEAEASLRHGLSQGLLDMGGGWSDAWNPMISLTEGDWELLKRDQQDKYNGLVRRGGRIGAETQLHWRVIPGLFTRYTLLSLSAQEQPAGFLRSRDGIILEPGRRQLLLAADEEGYLTWSTYMEEVLGEAGLEDVLGPGVDSRISTLRWLRDLAEQGGRYLAGSAEEQLSFLLKFNNLCFPGQETLYISEVANTAAQTGIFLSLEAAAHLSRELGIEGFAHLDAADLDAADPDAADHPGGPGLTDDQGETASHAPPARDGWGTIRGDEAGDGKPSRGTNPGFPGSGTVPGGLRTGPTTDPAASSDGAGVQARGMTEPRFAALWVQFGPLLLQRTEGGDQINLLDRLLMGIRAGVRQILSDARPEDPLVVARLRVSDWILEQARWYVISPQQAVTALAMIWESPGSVPAVLESLHLATWGAEAGSWPPEAFAQDFWSWKALRSRKSGDGM